MLTTLEAVIVEIEAALNDTPLSFVSSEYGDLEPLNLLHGRLITCLPYETLDDDVIIDPEVCGNAKLPIYTSSGIMNTFLPYENFILT